MKVWSLFLGATLSLGAHAFVPHNHHASSLMKAKAAFISPQQQQQPTYSHSSQALQALVDPSYNLAIGAFGVGLASGFLEDIRKDDGEKLPTAKIFGGLALLFTIFAAFLTFQTTTLRFSFDDDGNDGDSFSLVKANGASMGENVVVGGENKWRYDSFVNWDFLPSSQFPILVYFRETQTPMENREEVPIVVDTLDGQVHFFPAISNTKQLEEGFLKNNCARISK